MIYFLRIIKSFLFFSNNSTFASQRYLCLPKEEVNTAISYTSFACINKSILSPRISTTSFNVSSISLSKDNFCFPSISISLNRLDNEIEDPDNISIKTEILMISESVISPYNFLSFVFFSFFVRCLSDKTSINSFLFSILNSISFSLRYLSKSVTASSNVFTSPLAELS